jgi:hypothetical protein
MHPKLIRPQLFVAKGIKSEDLLAVELFLLCTGSWLAVPECQAQSCDQEKHQSQ